MQMTRISLFISLLSMVIASCTSPHQKLRIAVSANMQWAAQELSETHYQNGGAQSELIISYLLNNSKSVLLFFARPSGVSLLAIGLSGPFPIMINLFGSKLYSLARKLATACALCLESDMFLSLEPVLSVFPSILTLE